MIPCCIYLTSGFGGSLGSLAAYLIGIIIIPGSLAPPIPMISYTRGFKGILLVPIPTPTL